jgi:transcriptional regulator with XRE-family HTH domain
MSRSLEEFIAMLPQRQRDAIARRVKEMEEEELTLQQLRKVRRMTQFRLAKALGISQDGVSKLENRSDLLLSTLTDYVESMGGTLRLVATFKGMRPVSIYGFCDIAPARKTKARKTKAHKTKAHKIRPSKRAAKTLPAKSRNRGNVAPVARAAE